jgi:REP element-mobilizing transposase RayT
VVKRILTERARQFGVVVHHYENMGNHLHLVVSFAKREGFRNFLRTVTAIIAREVTGARKGQPFVAKNVGINFGTDFVTNSGPNVVSNAATAKRVRFWDGLAVTRVITGLRDLRGIKNYLEKNALEREIGPLSRYTVEQYEAAERKARRRGLDVWQILEQSE